MGTVFIYGSIKKGYFNHSAYGFDKKTKYLGNATLEGATMYDLGSYPCIVLTLDKKRKVYGELYECLDEKCEKMIKNMELAAGYKEVEVIINDLKANTFIYSNPPKGALEIISGKWEKKR